jgi:hypothetical protein
MKCTAPKLTGVATTLHTGGKSHAIATFGGSSMPFCNYTSPLAKKAVFKDHTLVHYPLRKHIFRMKVKTAAEIRFFDIQKKYCADVAAGKYGANIMAASDPQDIDHYGSIIPKDEYEVRKFTSYLMSKKNSKFIQNELNLAWTKCYFMSASHNLVGRGENAIYSTSKPATDEEFMSFLWFVVMSTSVVSFFATVAWWWWKYGQAPEYAPLK